MLKRITSSNCATPQAQCSLKPEDGFKTRILRFEHIRNGVSIPFYLLSSF